MFPIFCKVSNDQHSIKEVVRQTLCINLFVSIPCMFAVITMASSIIEVFYSAKWLPCVPLFQVVCIYGAFLPLRVVNTDGVKSLGDSRLYMRLEMVQRVFVLVSIVLTIWQGIVPLLWGRTVACCSAVLLDMFLCGKRTGYGFFEQVSDQWKTVLGTILMCAGMSGIGMLHLAPIMILLSQTVVGLSIFVVSGCLLRNELCLKVILFLKNKYGK